MKFQIGDIITGTKEADMRYFVTNSCGTYEVISESFSSNNVRVISQQDCPNEIGNEYCVNLDYFVLVRRKNGIFSTLFDDDITDENVSDLFIKDSPAQLQLEKEFEEYKRKNK